ncbi:MAG: LysR substrate-binding domain-containing protein, partial [Clostridiales bacterium]|nr:LysR substrate-binding domain-containing protein [Clostridiales bacterium]
KNMRLTNAGEIMRELFTTLNADCKKIDRRIKKLNEEPKSLTMGATSSIGEYVMPSVLKRYLELNPQAKISMDVENTANLFEKLKTGKVDFLILEGKFDKNAYWHRLFSIEKFVCLCPPAYMPAEEEMDIENLFKNRLFLRESGSGTREIFESSLKEMGYSKKSFKAITEVGSLNAIKTLVAEGCGISFMFEAAAEEELKSGKLKKINVKGFNTDHEFNFVCLKNTMFLDEFEMFFDFAVKNK